MKLPTRAGAVLLPSLTGIPVRPQYLSLTHNRLSSHSPSPPPTLTANQKPITIPHLHKLYRNSTPITMLTAHDYPSALLAQAALIDIILIGDSLAMVSLGMPSTTTITLSEMILHARSVTRAATTAFTIGDLPMGSYEISPEQALGSAIRMMKEGRVQSVKLEGGAEMEDTIRKITTAGIPVCGHVGLTPQRQHALGGFRVQGNTVAKAMDLLRDARAVEAAGAFAVVLECVPPDIAAEITSTLTIPTIGIGAGAATSGQVLVQMDMLGFRPPGSFLPKFVKRYGSQWESGLEAIRTYREDVVERRYPAEEFAYKSQPEVAQALRERIRGQKTGA
jgi:3-methyl-2-oxobutanoate hydroxymethyltransferase